VVPDVRAARPWAHARTRAARRGRGLPRAGAHGGHAGAGRARPRPAKPPGAAARAWSSRTCASSWRTSRPGPRSATTRQPVPRSLADLGRTGLARGRDTGCPCW
jgi:hypothetical protein